MENEQPENDRRRGAGMRFRKKQSLPWSGQAADVDQHYSLSGQEAIAAGLLPASYLIKWLRQHPDWPRIKRDAAPDFDRLTADVIDTYCTALERHHFRYADGRVELRDFYQAEAALTDLREWAEYCREQTENQTPPLRVVRGKEDVNDDRS